MLTLLSTSIVYICLDPCMYHLYASVLSSETCVMVPFQVLQKLLDLEPDCISLELLALCILNISRYFEYIHVFCQSGDFLLIGYAPSSVLFWLISKNHRMEKRTKLLSNMAHASDLERKVTKQIRLRWKEKWARRDEKRSLMCICYYTLHATYI